MSDSDDSWEGSNYDTTDDFIDEVWEYMGSRLGNLLDCYDSDALHIQKNSRIRDPQITQQLHKLKFYCEGCDRSWTSAKGLTEFDWEAWEREGDYGDACNLQFTVTTYS